MHCTRPQAGHPLLDATPAGPRGELATGTSSSMHPSQCHILCRWSYQPPLPMYPPCWRCPGQRAEHRGFPTLCLPSPGHSQVWGFSVGVERGGHREGTLTIKRLDSSLLRNGMVCFLMKEPSPRCPSRKICCTHFCSLLHFDLPGTVV